MNKTSELITARLAELDWQELRSGLTVPERNKHHVVWERHRTPNSIRNHELGSVMIDVAVHNDLHADAGVRKYQVSKRRPVTARGFALLLQQMESVDKQRTNEEPVEVYQELAGRMGELGVRSNLSHKVRRDCYQLSNLLEVQLPYIVDGEGEL